MGESLNRQDLKEFCNAAVDQILEGPLSLESRSITTTGAFFSEQHHLLRAIAVPFGCLTAASRPDLHIVGRSGVVQAVNELFDDLRSSVTAMSRQQLGQAAVITGATLVLMACQRDNDFDGAVMDVARRDRDRAQFHASRDFATFAVVS